jgi:PAS domain S-box-containing protein
METEQKSILLVEDEPILALAEKQRLEQKGYRVHHVSTGEKGVVTVLEEPFPIDLVLMDINLGKGIDGTEAARQILEHKDIPVVFLSSHTEPEVVEKTEKITSYGYVVKNSGVVVLDASIKMALKLFAARMERKEAELEAQKRETFLNKVFEVLPIGLWFADEKGTLRQGNPAGIKIWGAEPKVPLEKYGVFKARRLPSGEELSPEDWALAHTVKEGVTIADELLEIEAFDGVNRIILNYTAPVVADDGRLLGAVIVNNDITEQYRAEEELRESEARNRESALLLDTSQRLAHIGGWEWDLEKRIMKWTDEAYRIHGIKPGEIPAGSPLHINRSISCYLPEDRPRIETAFRRCVEDGVPYDLEFPLNRLDGERIWIRTMANALRAGDRIVKVVGYIMDITRQKQAEELIQNERRRLAGIIEGTNAGTWEWNTQTGETTFNERWAAIIGYTWKSSPPYQYRPGNDSLIPGISHKVLPFWKSISGGRPPFMKVSTA